MRLGLNPAQIELISQFVDVYLELNTQEEAIFQSQLATIEPAPEEEVMEIVTSWQRRGREEGREQGKQLEASAMVLRLLNRRVGALTPLLQERIQQLSTPQLEDLGEALLDFSAISQGETAEPNADLENWLIAHEN